jgi:hypothetical protein
MIRALLASACVLALPGCSGFNAWVAAAENSAVADTASAVNNIHTANVSAVELWVRSSCGLTLGGLAGAGNAKATEAAIALCTPSGVTMNGITVPSANTATPINPFALPAPTASP